MEAHLYRDDEMPSALEEVGGVDGDDPSLVGLRHVREDGVYHGDLQWDMGY